MREISNAMLVAFFNTRLNEISEITGKPRSLWDYNHTIAVLKAWMNWAVSNDYTPHNQFKGIKKRKIQAERVPLSLKELYLVAHYTQTDTYSEGRIIPLCRGGHVHRCQVLRSGECNLGG